MHANEVIRGWGQILSGRKPFLSIEITRECPLRCPGCYAYDAQHLGLDGLTLRDLNDLRGDALVEGILRVIDEVRPLHVSLVGGDPLVRYRELEQVLPELSRRGLYVQLVTSAFREIPAHWADIPHLNLTISIDGLQKEHDERRKPATYERILKTTANVRITVHCTITALMLHRPGYLQEFLDFWTPRPNVRRVWFSIFTPQQGDTYPEILTPKQREQVVAELIELRPRYPKLEMGEDLLREFLQPPISPAECIFAQTTETVSADLKTRITPCQFGGKPDCANCGCIASMGLASLAHKEAAGLSLGAIFRASLRVGRMWKRAA